MTTREQFVAEARSWEGTPFHHQANLKGVGVDCVGLIRGAAIELGMMPRDWQSWPGVDKWRGYSYNPDGTLIEACDTYLHRKELPLEFGDVIVVAWVKDGLRPRHLGVVVDPAPGRMYWVHAENYRHKRVVYGRLMLGKELRLIRAYSVPGLA
jgi:cell wall-associated NlpC family hydrolase